jgi:hypothetical protein
VNETWSFDAEAAAGSDPTAGGAVAVELPPDQQTRGMLWPTPADQVSDHSAEGAPWQPAAGTMGAGYGWEFGPPGGGAPPRPEFVADHSGPTVPYDAAAQPNRGQTMGPQPGWPHAGSDGSYWNPGDDGTKDNTAPNSWGGVNIGKPFTIDQGSSEHRTLATDQWDGTGKRISPQDAPSAPHELYGSEHYTRPRMTPYELGPLFDWSWPEAQQWTLNPGYWGVAGGEPDASARPFGAVSAQPPTDPYVADSTPGPVQPAAVDYEWAF